MAPVLLDQRTIFRAGIAVSFTLLVVFFTGYYTGYQKADSGRIMGLNKTIALALPKPAHAETTEYEPRSPHMQIPGVNIDVDSPEYKAADSDIEQQPAAHMHVAGDEVESVIKETTAIINTPTDVEVSAEKAVQPLQLASLAITPGVLKEGADSAIIEQAGDRMANAGDMQATDSSTESANNARIVDTASAADARYTVQVGVFADSENAIRRMSELESQKLSAYTEGYTNKGDELRFNVRFGYFNDKSSAVAALNSFEQHMSGSGYVTRIRRN